ncbi:MAG: hypothetical protein M1840_002118 [Geoglossum simile]|nr:MAG: hypothetical protein M1840_002118 [Geoglossum simile]
MSPSQDFRLATLSHGKTPRALDACPPTQVVYSYDSWGLVGSAWRAVFAFRSKRRKEHENGHDEGQRKPRKSVGSLFFALPTELRIYILRELHYIDILSLRLASRSFHQLIEANEAQIVRHHIEYHVPRHILELYPPPQELNLKFLTSLAQRQWLSCNMAQHLAEYISKQVQGQSLAGSEHFRLQHLRMRRRLVPLIFTLFHFFERYRYKLLAETYTDNKVSDSAIGQHSPIQQDIMKAYNPALLLRVSQTYHLLLYLLYQRLAPNKAFSFARTRPNEALDRSFEDGMVKLLIVGGINQVERIWSIKNRSRRRKETEKWVTGLQSRVDSRRQGSSAKPRIDHGRAIDGEESRDSADTFGHEHMPSAFELLTPHLPDFAISRLIPVLPPLRAVWVSPARDLILAKGLDIAGVGVWELFIDELISGDDSEDEYEHLEDDDSGDEDPDDSEDESEAMCLARLTLAEDSGLREHVI